MSNVKTSKERKRWRSWAKQAREAEALLQSERNYSSRSPKAPSKIVLWNGPHGEYEVDGLDDEENLLFSWCSYHLERAVSAACHFSHTYGVPATRLYVTWGDIRGELVQVSLRSGPIHGEVLPASASLPN